MKKLLKILLVMSLFNTQCLFVNAQNLVPNGSFEQYTQCPNSTAQLSYTTDWVMCGSSTDYFNSCSPPGNMSVPSNIFGNRNAAHGNAYIGMYTYIVNEGPPFTIREPVGTYLTQPLVIGEKYFVSFKSSLVVGDNTTTDGGCSHLGAKLSTVPFSDINNNPVPVNNVAQIFTNSIIIDTTNWTTISGSFIADSAYTFLVIGNFFDSIISQYQRIDTLQSYPFPAGSYYFIDDVRLSTDSFYVYSAIENNLNQSETIMISSYVVNDYLHINNKTPNKFTLTIFNLLGQALLQTEIEPNQVNIDIRNFSNGPYIVTFVNSSQILSKKIIKK